MAEEYNITNAVIRKLFEAVSGEKEFVGVIAKRADRMNPGVAAQLLSQLSSDGLIKHGGIKGRSVYWREDLVVTEREP